MGCTAVPIKRPQLYNGPQAILHADHNRTSFFKFEILSEHLYSHRQIVNSCAPLHFDPIRKIRLLPIQYDLCPFQ